VSSRSGGQLLADQLALHGVELAFCVPGESYLALLDGLYTHREHLRVITCRHEAAAANAADAYGKLKGQIEKVQALGLNRVDARACNIGQDADAMLQDVVSTEHLRSGFTLEGERDTYLHRIAFQMLSEASLDPAASRALILKTAESYWSGAQRHAHA